MLCSCRGRRVFVLDTGCIRLTLSEAKTGDLSFAISRVSVTFVLAQKNGGLKLVGVLCSERHGWWSDHRAWRVQIVEYRHSISDPAI
jgi:hypothetical protein